MDTVLDDTVIIHQNTGEHGYVRRKEQRKRMKNARENLSHKRHPYLVGSAINFTLPSFIPTSHIFSNCVVQEDIKTCVKRKLNPERKVWKIKPNPKSLNVCSRSEVNGAKRQKYVTVWVNDHEAKLLLDAAFDITLISRKTQRDLAGPAQIPTKILGQNASNGILNFAGEMECRALLW